MSFVGRALFAALLTFASIPKTDLLDINTASAAQLAALPGMGAEYARRVIGHRPYSAKNQLVTQGILPETEYARIVDLIIAHRVAKTSSGN
jgi:competence protein ComEA